MRKEQRKYKVCERLGYNARLRLWSGKKKKWEKSGRFYEKAKEGEVVKRNPLVFSSNEERRRERNPYRKESMSERNQPKRSPMKKKRMRRKDMHRRGLRQKAGLKTRYGGLKREQLQKETGVQRDRYKAYKSEKERRYRKGMKDQEIMRTRQTHRLGKIEVRVDRRRWRSGRVPTLQMARDLVEHEKVQYVNEDGTRGSVVKWQGAQLEVGHGRKIKETAWKQVKEKAKERVSEEAYAMTGVGYMEVDYVTGRRVLLRMPEENEVIVPKGMRVTSSVRK